MTPNMIKVLSVLQTSKLKIGYEDIKMATGLKQKSVDAALTELHSEGLAKRLKNKDLWFLSAAGCKVVQAIRESFSK